MAQAIEITEEKVMGTTHKTPLTKSYNTAYILDNQDLSSGGSAISLRGRAQKDVREISEAASAVEALANAAPTTDIEKLMTLNVKQFPGKPAESSPVAKNFAKSKVIEFFADPNEATDTVIIESYGNNDAERLVYIVDETYTAVKALWLL